MSSCRAVLCGLLCILAMPVWAVSDVRGSSDYPLLERYPRAYIVNYKQLAEPDYRWALGALEKVDGVVTAEKEERLKGQLTRISYRIPAGVTPTEAFEYMAGQLRTLGAQQRFNCEGRACGSSHQWANNVFRYSKLYGVERSQHYAAFLFNNTAVALYSVQRGNKRVFLHLDLLEQARPDLVKQLQSKGYVRWPAEQEGSEALIDYLLKQTDEVWLVGHQQKSGDAQSLLNNSEQLAQAVADKLREGGIAADRLQVFGVGALAPGLVKAGEEAVFLIQRTR